MYTAVLLLAVTAGSESTGFGHRNGCSSCSGYACSGYASGCFSGCSGYSGCSNRHHGGHFGRHRHGGCSGCSSYGCTGYGCSGYGVACSGYVGGCYGSTIVCSGGVVVPQIKIEMKGEKKTMVDPKDEKKPDVKPKPEDIKKPAGTTQIFAPATIIVSLPVGARLTVDGTPTMSTSERRTFLTPNLQHGVTYAYTLRAETTSGVREERVTVRAGETSTVQFNFEAQGVASR